MNKKSNEAVCKKCGKIIVGSSKTGLCESCSNKKTGQLFECLSSFVVGVVGVVGAFLLFRNKDS